MNHDPVFIITIDTEGDNLWSIPSEITTENARYLPRFQRLCETYHLKPTYLVDYEMAQDPYFQAFGRDVAHAGRAEIGLHIHPWNTPPLIDDIGNGYQNLMYLYELPDDALEAKLTHLHHLLTDVFQVQPLSHRAGRWGFDERVARMISDLGYRVDCSVTPGVSWRRNVGASKGSAGPEYQGFPKHPYRLDLNDIRQEGASPLLEVPVTVRPNYEKRTRELYAQLGHRLLARAVRGLFGSPYRWLRPTGGNLDEMLTLVDECLKEPYPVMEFILHSSEFMPGGSPTFPNEAAIDTLYDDLENLFTYTEVQGIRGVTLREYLELWQGLEQAAP